MNNIKWDDIEHIEEIITNCFYGSSDSSILKKWGKSFPSIFIFISSVESLFELYVNTIFPPENKPCYTCGINGDKKFYGLRLSEIFGSIGENGVWKELPSEKISSLLLNDIGDSKTSCTYLYFLNVYLNGIREVRNHILHAGPHRIHIELLKHFPTNEIASNIEKFDTLEYSKINSQNLEMLRKNIESGNRTVIDELYQRILESYGFVRGRLRHHSYYSIINNNIT